MLVLYLCLVYFPIQNTIPNTQRLTVNGDRSMNENGHGSNCHDVELLRVREWSLKETEVHRRGDGDPFTYCGGRIHVLLLTKIISVLTIPLYLIITAFIYCCGNLTSVMFVVIILGSVGIFTVYGSFKGAKMCLIPFVILQIIFLIYDLILIALLLFAVVFREAYLFVLIRSSLEDIPFNTDYVLLLLAMCLAGLLAPLLWTTHVVYINFLFIAQIDEAIHILKEANQRASDELSPSRMNF